MSENLFTTDELRAAMLAAYSEIIAFVTSPPFRGLCDQLNTLSPVERDAFVRAVLLDAGELSSRGVVVPTGLLIQRSAFGDRRPTLFCVKKYLPQHFHGTWENVNLTFDALFEDESISRTSDTAWRYPVRPDIQAFLLASGLPLEHIPAAFQVSQGFMGEGLQTATA